jgi:hypothetical protein
MRLAPAEAEESLDTQVMYGASEEVPCGREDNTPHCQSVADL